MSHKKYMSDKINVNNPATKTQLIKIFRLNEKVPIKYKRKIMRLAQIMDRDAAVIAFCSRKVRL